MRSNGKAAVLGILLGFAVASCTRPSGSEYWHAGAAYDLQVVVLERPAQLPGTPLPTADSLRLLVTVDSVRADSLFGTYGGSLDSLGISLRDDDTIARRMVGWVSADSFVIVLDPAFLDGHLSFSGMVRDGVGRGLWRQVSPAAPAGGFEIRRRQ